MPIVAKSFRALNASDLMSQTVMVVPQEMSLQGAARMLSQGHVSGAPVVDGEGRCVGVISATDFLHWAEKGGPAARPPGPAHPAVSSAWQILDAQGLPDNAVRCHMTPDPVTVAPGTGIRELARMMLDAHIHRLVVVDAERRPVGIVSSTDVLAAVAYADDAP